MSLGAVLPALLVLGWIASTLRAQRRAGRGSMRCRWMLAGALPLRSATCRASATANTIALPGGRDNEGVLNVLGTGPLGRNGYDTRELAGSGYMQVVGWNGGEPVADALLTCGQQADPGAPHARDQTVRYAAGHWIRLPFTPRAIAAEPHKRKLHLVAP